MTKKILLLMAKTFVAMVILIVIQGCSPSDIASNIPIAKIMKNDKKQLIISSSSLLNNNSSVMVDVVQASDQHLYEMISKMSSKEYFESKEKILQNPSAKIWHLQIPPKFYGGFALEGYSKKSYGTILFTGYHVDSGNDRTNLKNGSNLTKLQLGDYCISSAAAFKCSPNSQYFKKIVASKV